MARPERFELEPFCGRERSGSPQAKSRAERGIWGITRCRGKDGAPGEIRTPDLQLRRLPLYPAELRARCGNASVHRGSACLNGCGQPGIRCPALEECAWELGRPSGTWIIASTLGHTRNSLRLHVKYPCDNLNNCPGLQEGTREVLCPKGLASTCWRSSVGRASDL
jgi:hypothetical protein